MGDYFYLGVWKKVACKYNNNNQLQTLHERQTNIVFYCERTSKVLEMRILLTEETLIIPRSLSAVLDVHGKPMVKTKRYAHMKREQAPENKIHKNNVWDEEV